MLSIIEVSSNLLIWIPSDCCFIMLVYTLGPRERKEVSKIGFVATGEGAFAYISRNCLRLETSEIFYIV